MQVIADLHLHSKYSRATSKNLDLANLEKYAKLKGITLLGTGDFTHPVWIKELKSQLKENSNGILASKTGFNFLLSVEISNIYTQDGKGRRIHNIILAPGFEVVDQITEALGKKGRLDYDGRPIFGFSCIELVEMMKSISSDIEIIPAHIWTPWFSLFGSMSGFDSIQDCFKEQTKHIHAIETGMSSNPAMNWRIKELDNMAIVSFSDAHSFWPWRLGREATVFDIDLSYKNIINALRTKKGLKETIEVDPGYGKYHYDGHRNCNVCMSPKESAKNKDICPKCKRKLTIGVAHRVEELAGRDFGYKPKDAIGFKSLMPLSEIIAGLLDTGVASKSVFQEYHKLIKAFSTEFNVLLNASHADLKNVVHEKIADALINNREGKIDVAPGYDGEYGKPVFSEKIKLDKPKAPQRGVRVAKRLSMPQRGVRVAKRLSMPQKGLEDFY